MAERTQHSLISRVAHGAKCRSMKTIWEHTGPGDTKALIYETNKSLVRISSPFRQSQVSRVLLKSLSHTTLNANLLIPIPRLNIESFFPISRTCLAQQQTHNDCKLIEPEDGETSLESVRQPSQSTSNVSPSRGRLYRHGLHSTTSHASLPSAIHHSPPHHR